MKIKATFKFRYSSQDGANTAQKSLNPDNLGYIESFLEDESLVCIIKGDSIGTVLSTADDLIFCEMMVEKVAELEI